jgi:hypothetical protein
LQSGLLGGAAGRDRDDVQLLVNDHAQHGRGINGRGIVKDGCRMDGGHLLPRRR